MDEHEELELLLRQKLRPRSAPAGFTGRVMARLPGTPQARSVGKERPFRGAAMRWAAAAVLLAFAGGSYWEHQRQEQMAGERAHSQLMLALHISSATLNDVQHKIMRDTGRDAE